jgi:tetratricopeptide (TPR) repeat protein
MAEAEEFVRKAIAIIRSVYGDEHQKLAIFINNLADVLSITAKYDEAKQLYTQAMAINTKCLGADHPEVSENLNSLGMIAKKVRTPPPLTSIARRAERLTEGTFFLTERTIRRGGGLLQTVADHHREGLWP